jgi:asparagine synthase (glutamine-hydrolysing)
MDVSSGDFESHKYITPTTKRFQGSIDDAIIGYETALKQAVKKQLLSDVPVGLLLSGGIDSALIAAISRDLGHKLPCYTVGFGHQHDECEISDAEQTAQVLGLPHLPVTVTPDMLQQAFPAILASVEEPLGTTSILPMWYLVQRASKDVTVVLTGQGTDEPWGGYRRYQVEMVRKMLPFTSLWKIIKGAVPSLDTKSEILERGLRTLSVGNTVDRFVEACALFPAQDRLRLTGHDSQINQAHQLMRQWHEWLSNTHCEPAEQMMRMDTRMNLADDLLLYGDKISMASSIEARVPMLDISLVEFIESLPLSYRVALSRSKIVHKRMAERYLPASIVHRKKKGFQVPFGTWSRGIWREWVEATLLDRNAPHFAHLEYPAVEKLWKQHLAQKPDRSRQMFALLMFAIWRQQQ